MFKFIHKKYVHLRNTILFFRLFSALVVFVMALIGTAIGNLLRVAVDRKYRTQYVRPDSDDLIITGVFSNGLIATIIALLTGRRRLWGAVVGGTILTFLFGDRLDRNPEEIFVPVPQEESASEQQNSTEPNGTAFPSERPMKASSETEV